MTDRTNNQTPANEKKIESNQIYQNIKQIFIANILETNYRAYQGLPDKERAYWTAYDSLEGNRAFLYSGDDKIVITSSPIQQEHKDYICKLMNWTNAHNVSPRIPSAAICEDIMRPGKFRDLLINTIQANPGVAIIPYRSTREFYQLVGLLRRNSLDYTLPETVSEGSAFISAYSNSKRGFRHLWNRALGSNTKIPIDIPQGFIVANKDEAIECAWWFQQQKKSFVFKYNRGTQGVGVTFFKTSQLPKSYKAFRTQLLAMLSDKLWDDPLIVVEEYIAPDPNVLGGSPSVELFINMQGQVKPTYGGEQIMADDKKTFAGFYIHPEATYHPYIQTAFRAGTQFGEELAEMGYHGYFDVDLVAGKDGQVYAIESNLRRTGGTHFHDAATSLLGENYSSNYHVLGEDIHLPEEKRITYEQCTTAFEKLLYNPKTQTGFIFANPDMLQVNILHAMFIAPSKRTLEHLRRQIRQILQTL